MRKEERNVRIEKQKTEQNGNGKSLPVTSYSKCKSIKLSNQKTKSEWIFKKQRPRRNSLLPAESQVGPKDTRRLKERGERGVPGMEPTQSRDGRTQV